MEYKTKAAQKRDLEKLNKEYEKIRKEMMDYMLDESKKGNHSLVNTLYYQLPLYLHQFSEGHATMFSDHFRKEVVEIFKLKGKREEIKNAEITPKLSKKEEIKKELKMKDPVNFENIKKIVELVKEDLKPQLEKWKEGRYNFIKNLEVYCKKDVYEISERETGKKHNSNYIHKLRIAKGWSPSMESYFGRTESELRAKISKDADDRLFNAERAIYNKLNNEKVETVENLFFSEGHGAWKINGQKTLSYETIMAGGYNIQCLHIRTIFKYR